MIEKMMNKMGWVKQEKLDDMFSSLTDTVEMLNRERILAHSEGRRAFDLEKIVYEARTKRDSKGRFRKTKNLAKLLLQYEAKYK
tara:strand:+ start:44 stop:295 length:252 start_codon:yes stop_codon:yes gene_type:complete